MSISEEVRQKLLAPFEKDEVDFLPRATSGGKALALAYIDARTVMRRLDEATDGEWSFDFDPLNADGTMVRGRLVVCGILRCDAGESAKEEEPLKSAVSDALKRSAVHFGIGRYLYYLPQVWCEYDPQKRRWTKDPEISSGAIQHALKQCGYAGAFQNAPAPRPAAQQQAPAPNANGKPQDPEAARKRYFAVLKEHFGDMTDPLRHAVTGVLAGKLTAMETKNWDGAEGARKYAAVADRCENHARVCDGACEVLTAAVEMCEKASVAA